MDTKIELGDHVWRTNLAKPLDISIPLREGAESPNCFYAPLMRIEPVIAGDFIGDTDRGGLLNFKNVILNPHGNGTHTECYGHITSTQDSLQDCLKRYHFLAALVTVYPTRMENGDRVITRSQLEALKPPVGTEALIVRTMPNTEDKMIRQWSGSNPPYLSHEAASLMVAWGVLHLLIDLPSVDREEDEGALSAHRAFWGFPDAIRREATITEMIYVPDFITDGSYLLNIQVTSIVLDVSPSKPVLYPLKVCP